MPAAYDWIGIDPAISKYAVSYVKIVFPATLFFFGNQTLFSFAASQKILKFVVTGTIFGTITHAFLIYLLCFVYDWGFNGIMWATTANFVVRFLI